MFPPPPPVEITHHRIFKGWCAGCQKWHEAPVDVQEQVLGQGRLGVRTASLIASLRTVMRLPFRQIQAYLLTFHGLQVSLEKWWKCCTGFERMPNPCSMASKLRCGPVQRCRPMRPDGGKMEATATPGASRLPRFAITNTTTAEPEKSSNT